MLQKIFFLLIFIFLSLIKPDLKADVYIIANVDGQIITNYDIKKEAEYLKILNPNLSQLDEKKTLKISKESLIREIIKKKEIKKKLDLDKENPYVDEYLKDLYTRLEFNNEKDFQTYLLNTSKYSIEEIKQKLKIEIMWNELIYFNYGNQVNIDKNELLKKIDNLSNKTINEYKLSEIVFKKRKSESLENLIDLIKTSITDVGFSNTANIYSISESSKFGGKIGWIEENNLSKLIAKKLKKIQDNKISEIVKIGNNYIILEVEEVRQKKISFNKDEKLKEMIKFETNKQLNQFSKIFYDKSKMNYSINEK